jgi:hypothetical protein
MAVKIDIGNADTDGLNHRHTDRGNTEEELPTLVSVDTMAGSGANVNIAILAKLTSDPRASSHYLSGCKTKYVKQVAKGSQTWQKTTRNQKNQSKNVPQQAYPTEDASAATIMPS